jgi:hypothetical protein
LRRAAEVLDGGFPVRDVSVYLAALLALDPVTWEGLADVLESRRAAART